MLQPTRLFGLLLALVIAALPLSALAAGAGGVTAPSIYVDGQLYRTVGTPTDFSNTGAPPQSFEVLYQFFGLQPNVAVAAPGDPGFRGGRWQVHGLSFGGNYAATLADPQVDLNHNGVLDSDEEVNAAISHGYATDTGVIKMFECPVIKVPANSH